jgi:F420-dependent oxidoreductase-like protein
VRIGFLDTDIRLPRDAAGGAAAAEARGLDTYWLPGGWRDPLTLLAVAGQTARTIELGSSIASIYGVHPTALAEQALTVNSAVDGRFVLGLGTSHPHMVEQRFGGSFATPIRQLRAHLSILMPLLHDGKVEFSGESLSAHTELRIPATPAPAVVVAALSDQTLRVSGRLADGTLTTWVGPRQLGAHTVPTITAAAADAGRPAPRVIASMPVCVSEDADAARAVAAEEYAMYVHRYTAYRATFERQGVGGPAPLVVVGDEQAVADHLQRFADAGATDFCAHLFGTDEQRTRTLATLADLAGRHR